MYFFIASLPGSGRERKKLKPKRKRNESESGRRTLRYSAAQPVAIFSKGISAALGLATEDASGEQSKSCPVQ